MQSLITRLWNDDNGFIVSAELVLVATIVVIGMITGLVAIRNDVTSELTEVGQAISAIDQSYSYSTLSNCSSSTAGSNVTDTYNSINSSSSNATQNNINVQPCSRAN
ncbi:MAG TPA: hypothetical protein VFE62_25680 [Gemmataceae bacterium]|nr:hypothetical protein [Gemmataceae bacterium]